MSLCAILQEAIGAEFPTGILIKNPNIGGPHFPEYPQHKPKGRIILYILTPQPKRYFIESKNRARDLDENIGNRLTEYVKFLFKIPPTAYKLKTAEWCLHEEISSPLSEVSIFSGGAFCYANSNELKESMNEGNLDFIIAFEFNSGGGQTIGHVLLSDKCKFLRDILINIASQFSVGFKIKIY